MLPSKRIAGGEAMGKNYDLIATVDIDIASPIVDDASFDNLLIMGPAPKGESKAPDIGVYASLMEVEDAGFVSTGADADPNQIIIFAHCFSPPLFFNYQNNGRAFDGKFLLIVRLYHYQCRKQRDI